MRITVIIPNDSDVAIVDAMDAVGEQVSMGAASGGIDVFGTYVSFTTEA